MSRNIVKSAAVVGAAIAALSLSAAPGMAQEVTLRMHTFIPPVANPGKTFLAPWAAKIEKDSGGRLKIQPFWAMQLGGKAPQLLDQARDGVVDIVWTLPGFSAGRMPEVEPFELPFVHKDALSTTLALQDFQAKNLGKALGAYHPLLLHSHQGFLFQTKEPVQKMEDLKGMKLRAASRGGVWLLEALGATGVGLPLPAIPAALSKGVIDGVTLPFEIAPAVKTPDLVSHFSSLAGAQPRLGTNVFTFLMNKASYDKLPPDLQKVIDDNSGTNIARQAGQNWIDVETPGRNAVAAKPKNKFYEIPEAEVAKMKAAAQPVFDRWYGEVGKSGIDGPALVKDARDMIAKYSGAS
ncbi:MAG: TRAP transporter substrate-binding protein [Rhodospirillaceae bacterium]|jgi:TRAP-type C4-dicarboxylate transport system substrate-binding protein|nr:TRAP transporter substrate-binding protein [Rhodospirillaceae bacterium]MBT3810701.1 TRAP transporter substrate-binding protein [Rhodospirillaceae bacterium]MBT3930711.1 TRAP transporter substrate-binding protein [Rhodospirillaceae bacterium]MBT4773248.1 TRAP transporter substrate-binding protein [Rhodospirillaceae bacterium]MBT5356961.1 TRAP transporter substrate-binding protein [Rhodospirillaceae bacterium]